MAKKSRRGRLVVLPINAQITLGTTGDGAAVLANLIAALTEDIWVHSVDLTWALRGLTSGEVPIQVGISQGDLTAAEVVEAVTASPTGPGDIIANEHARRPVRISGQFGDVGTDQTLAHGEMIRTKARFLVSDGKAFNAWALNRTGAAYTTGAVVRVTGRLYGRWLI